MCKFVFLSALIISMGFTACDAKNTNPDNSNPDDSGKKTHTINFDPNGGTGGQTATVTATVGQAMPALTAAPPVKIENVSATYDNRIYTGFNKEFYFDGYFDAPSGGTKYYNADLSSAENWDKENDTTLHAQWTSIESKYGVTLTAFDYTAHFTETAPVIDGNGNDSVWEKAQWKPIDQVWRTPNSTSFTPPPPENFTGRYKMLWTAERLYYLVEITDDVKSVTRQTADPYNQPYEDDCLELFINEDGQGGTHTNNNIAFAYHMCFDSLNAMDYVGGQPNALPFKGGYIKRNHHMNYKIGETAAPVYIWEIALKVYDKNCPVDDNPDTQPPTVPVTLTECKMMRFAIAYNDADNTHSREYFIGSVFVSGANADARNQAYQTADVFSKLYLVE
jgi:hypothetical protein